MVSHDGSSFADVCLDIVVGQIIGQGYEFKFSNNLGFTGVTLCITLPANNSDWDLRARKYRDKMII